MGRDGSGVKAASKSSIEISFEYLGKRRRERIKLAPTAQNLRRVTAHRTSILDAIARGTFDYCSAFPKAGLRHRLVPSTNDLLRLGVSNDLSSPRHHQQPTLTVAAYLERWLEIKRTQIKASTLRDYEGITYSLLIPAFRNTLLSDLRRPTIKRWLATLDATYERKLSNKRLANIQSCLRCALAEAMEDELISSNPLHGYTFARLTPPIDRDHADPMTREEQAAIIAHARHPQIANLFQFAFWTGLRTSELIALDWRDVDEQRGVIRVRRAITRASQGEAETTKTRAGRREVKLLFPALAALSQQRQFTYTANAEIFQHPGWNRRPPARWKGDDEIWETWRTAIRNAGVRYRNPYQTRHTYASMMLSAGENLMWVAHQMGHSDTHSIMRNYGRWIPVSNTEAGDKAVAMFS